MPQSDIITAEPWTAGSVATGIVLFVAVIGLIVWLVLRYGGRGT